MLTTQAVDRAIAAYREVVESRLDGMDRATQILAGELVKIERAFTDQRHAMQDDFTRRMLAEREFILGQIKIVSKTANERSKAVDGIFASNALALTAALAAQKEAAAETNKANTLMINKSEQATKETINANALLSTTSIEDLRGQINGLLSRLDRGEAGTEVRKETRTEERLNVGQILVSVSVLIAAVGLFLNAVR